MFRTALLNGVGTVATLCALALRGPAVAETYITFSVNNDDTFVTAINSHDAVAGYDCDFGCSGYVRAADGTITSFDPAGSIDTQPTGINRKGTITGYFCESSDPCNAQGFVRKPGGTIGVFSAPQGYADIEPTAINDGGAVTGSDEDGIGHRHGFLRSSSSGIISTFDPTESLSTIPTAINSKGDIAGYYSDSAHIVHGFLRTADGTISSFDCRKSADTWAYGITEKDKIAGECANDDATKGFGRAREGAIKIFSVQDSSATYPHGMNDKGIIVGEYTDEGGANHGFVGSPNSGFTRFDVPGSSSTEGSAINAGGDVAGFYALGSSAYGFIRTAQ